MPKGEKKTKKAEELTPAEQRAAMLVETSERAVLVAAELQRALELGE